MNSGGLLTRAKNAWLELRAASVGRRVYLAALVVVVALGTFLRLNGYLGHQISFALDESLWAPRFISWPLSRLGIRPIGFVWLTRLIVSHFGASELSFRFLPNLGAVLSLWLMPYVASRLLASRVLRVLLVLVFAIHPGLVDLAKEFKPYSFEVLVHLVAVVLYLRYDQTRKAGYFYALLAYLPLAFLLAYNFAFAFPGLLLLAFLVALKGRRRLLVVTLLSAGLCAAVVYTTNQRMLAKVENGGKTEHYWGKKYDVFYRVNSEQSRLAWTMEKSGELASVIGLRRQLWEGDARFSPRVAEELVRADRILWMVLSALGVIALVWKRRKEALLWLTPLAVLMLVNAMGKWPFGQFRTNLFACVYLFPLPFLAVEMLSALAGRWARYCTTALIAVDVLFGMAFNFEWGNHKRTWCVDGYTRDVLPALYELRKEQLLLKPNAKRARLVVDLHTHKPLDYYLQVHPTFSEDYGDFKTHFLIDKVGSNDLVPVARRRLRGSGPVYVIASKPKSKQALENFAGANARVLGERRIGEGVLIMVIDD